MHALALSLALSVTQGASPASAQPAAPAAQQVVPPKLVGFVEAELPPGTPPVKRAVVLLITIDAQGVVTEVAVQTPAGEPWDTAAKAAAQQFGFEPATVDGAAVPVTVPFTYEFRAPARRGRIPEARQLRREQVPAPGYQVAGTLVEKGTRTPLAGVLVYVEDPRTGRRWELLTDAEGVFRGYGLSPGRLRVQVVTGEHKELRTTLRAQPEPKTPEGEVGRIDPTQTFYMAPSGGPRYGTIVRKPRPKAAAQEITLTEDEITKVPGSFGDPTRVVATLPGVTRSPFGLGYYVVRGANFDNTGFFIDGHPAFFLYHLLGGPAVIHPELVGELTFYPGGYPAEYGRFATGAIALKTKHPPNDRWHLDIEVDAFRASALFSVPFDDKKGQLTLSFRQSYYNLILPLVTDEIRLGYTDYMVRLTYDFTPRLRTRFIIFGAEDRLESGVESVTGEEQNSNFRLGFHRVNVAVDADLTEEITLKNSFAWEYDHTGTRRVAQTDDDLSVEFESWFAQLRTGLEVRPAKGYTFEVGTDLLYFDLKANLAIPTLPPLGDPRPPTFDPIILNQRVAGPAFSGAPYLQADLEVAKGLRLLPGVRATFDYYADELYVTADPKLAVRWAINDIWTLKAMGAMSNQLPPIFQTEEPFGDPSIPPIQGVQASLGFEWSHPEGWELSVEGFYNFLYNLSRPNNTIVEQEDGNIDRVLFTPDEEGRAYGLEVLFRKRMGGIFYGWISYTLSRAERLRPPDDWQLYELDQTHVLNLAWSVDLGDEWSLGARFTLTSGNTYFPILGSRYDADRDRYEPIFSDRRERLPFFHRLDVRLDKRFRFDTWLLEIYLDIQNVYNATNPESQRYSYDYSIQSDGPSIPILPTLGVRASF